MASNYGVPTVIDQDGVVLDMKSTAVSTVTAVSAVDDSKVQTMSAVDTMKEVFFEIRDGINYMVDIMAEGLEIEKKRFQREGLAGRNKQIASGNTDTSEVTPVNDGTNDLLAALKKAFDGLSPTSKGLLGIAGLIAALLFLNSQMDALIKLLTPILEFLGETLIPALKELNELILSHPGGYWTLLGAVGLVTTLGKVFGIGGILARMFGSISSFLRTAFSAKLAKTIGNRFGKSLRNRISRGLYGKSGIITRMSQLGRAIVSSLKAAFVSPGGLVTRVTSTVMRVARRIRGSFAGKAVKGIFNTIKRVSGRFLRILGSVFRTIMKAIGFVTKFSGLGAFLRLGASLARAIPILGQVVMVIQGIFGFIKGAIEGWQTGGVFGAIKGGLIGLYDGLLGNFLNLIADIIGWILTKFGLKGLGNFFSNLDFTFAGLKSAMITVFDSIRWAITKAINGMKFLVNKAISALNWVPGINFTPLSYTEFIPTPKASVQPVAPPPADDTSFMNTSDEAAKLESVKTTVSNINPEELANIDYSNMGPMTAPVFAPTNMTGPTTNVSNNSTTTTGFSSTHSDDIARTLTEIYSE